MLASSAKTTDDRHGRRRDGRDGESREPSSHVQPPATSNAVENAALRIGRTLFVKGDITAAEDLLIRGRVIGSVHVRDHVLTVGHGGNVTGEIVAEKMVVQGHVAGDVELHEQLVISPGGMVVGAVKAPSVSIREGGTLRQSPEGQVPDTCDETAQSRTASQAQDRTIGRHGSRKDAHVQFNRREGVADHAESNALKA